MGRRTTHIVKRGTQDLGSAARTDAERQRWGTDAGWKAARLGETQEAQTTNASYLVSAAYCKKQLSEKSQNTQV